MNEQYLAIICKLIDQQPLPNQLKIEISKYSDTEWEDFLAAVHNYGLTTLVYNHLKNLDLINKIPDAHQQTMHSAVLTNVARNSIFLHKAGMILNALNQAEIPAIGLKGVYLLENIYQDVSLRSMSDIDLLLRKQDIPKALRVCETLGYHPTTYFSIDDDNLDIKHVPPLKTKDGPYLELHWTILEENAPFSIEVEGLWTRAVPVTIAGVPAFAFSPEDLILHLCMHLSYQHEFNIGLRGLYDIAAVLHHFENQVDWHELITIAQAWGVTRVLWVSLELVSDFFSVPVPLDILNQLQPTQPKPWILQQARSQLILSQYGSGQMTPDLAKFASQGGILPRLRLILQRIFIPKRTLARLYNVPPTSLRIYSCYIRRMVDLIRQYRMSVRHILNRDASTMVSAETQQASQRLNLWMSEK